MTLGKGRAVRGQDAEIGARRSGLASGYFGPFAPRYSQGQAVVRPGVVRPGRPTLWRAHLDGDSADHSPGGPPIDEPPPFPKQPAPQQDPPKEPVAPPVI